MKGLRRDSTVWLLFAALLFAGGAFLTFFVTKVGRDTTPLVLLFTANGTAVRGARPTVAFHADGRDLEFVAGNIGAGLRSVNFGPLPARVAAAVECKESDIATVSAYASTNVQGHPKAYPQDDRFQMRAAFSLPQSYTIDVAALEHDYPYKSRLTTSEENVAQSPREIECRFPSVVDHDTFASRSLEVFVTDGTQFNRVTGNPDGEYRLPERVTVFDNDGNDVRVTNESTGQTRLGGTMPVTEATSLTFTWNSITAGEQRDLILVLIGTLIALGAAAAVEAARPYVHALTREQDEAE